MKQVILILAVLFVSCGKAEDTVAESSMPVIEDLDMIHQQSSDWITVSDTKAIPFKDTCLTTEPQVVTIDLADSIIYLKDRCSKQNLAVLAAKYQYPDGTLNIKSRIFQDTLITVSLGEYMGAYEEEYYELILDSIITKSIINDRTLTQLSKDSVRTIKTFNL